MLLEAWIQTQQNDKKTKNQVMRVKFAVNQITMMMQQQTKKTLHGDFDLNKPKKNIFNK